MNFLYHNVFGRMLLNLLLKVRVLNALGKWLKSPFSKGLISYYIKKNKIDMSEFKGQRYTSFAQFFGRTKEINFQDPGENVIISPCDGLFSVVPIQKDSFFWVKGIWYTLEELLQNKELADRFTGGLCMIFRLRAKDYHHFCYVDDAHECGRTYIPGKLHSVQPIALEKVPVFRENKRYLHPLDTKNFGPMVQIEVGAVLVGDVAYEVETGAVQKGEEAGHFELLGSTILLLADETFRKKIEWNPEFEEAIRQDEEVSVKYAQAIGTLK